MLPNAPILFPLASLLDYFPIALHNTTGNDKLVFHPSDIRCIQPEVLSLELIALCDTWWFATHLSQLLRTADALELSSLPECIKISLTSRTQPPSHDLIQCSTDIYCYSNTGGIRILILLCASHLLLTSLHSMQSATWLTLSLSTSIYKIPTPLLSYANSHPYYCPNHCPNNRPY